MSKEILSRSSQHRLLFAWILPISTKKLTLLDNILFSIYCSHMRMLVLKRSCSLWNARVSVSNAYNRHCYVPSASVLDRPFNCIIWDKRSRIKKYYFPSWTLILYSNRRTKMESEYFWMSLLLLTMYGLQDFKSRIIISRYFSSILRRYYVCATVRYLLLIKKIKYIL